MRDTDQEPPLYHELPFCRFMVPISDGYVLFNIALYVACYA